jgi:competence protein ComEC
MDKSPISYRSIVFTFVFSFLLLLLIGSQTIFYQKTKVVFCDVGQGDAAYIRTREKQDILIDAGPDRKVLSCLGKHMPFYDRKIELAFLSHPQKDHYGGYLEILDRYQIDNFIVSPLDNNTQSFNLLKRKLKEKKIKIRNLYAGEKIILGDRKANLITFLWPSRQYMAEKINKSNFSSQKNVLGAFSTNSDLNDFSAVFIFSQGDFDILFTGDASPEILNRLVVTINKLPWKKLDILKVPHHGSKNGLTKNFLQLADPTLSVISVGKNNAYGHPSPEILEMLKALKKQYLRTDEKGDIVVEVDEKGWRIINKNEK